MMDVSQRKFFQKGRLCVIVLHANDDKLPALLLDPLLSLDQLGELFAAEDSPEMSKKDDEQGARSRGFQERGAIG